MENQHLKDLFEKYLQYCQAIRNYAPVTIQGYKSTLKLFFRETNVNFMNDLNHEIIEQWFFDGRLKRKWCPVTFRHHHKRLNTFLQWLVDKGYIPINFAATIEKPKLEHKLPRTISKDQAQMVLDCAFYMRYTYKFEKFRNRAIIGLMLLAGLRRKEVICLKMSDVSLETKTIFINQGKGHKDRLIPINFNSIVF